MMSLAACRGEGPMAAAPQGDGKWTEYMKAFNGRLYRPDVAPADAPLTPVESLEPAARSPDPADAQAAPTQPAPAPPQSSAPSPNGGVPRLAINNPLFNSSPAKRK